MTQAIRKLSDVPGDDAITFLKEEHRKIKALFAEFAQLVQDDDDDDEAKLGLVRQICEALTVHTQIEEEIFYPAVRATIDDDELMDEADMQHAEAKNLIALLMDVTTAEGGRYDATVTVLAEIIDHHIEEEEGKMFPKVKKAKIDVAELGEALDQSREELQGEMDEAVPQKISKAHTR